MARELPRQPRRPRPWWRRIRRVPHRTRPAASRRGSRPRPCSAASSRCRRRSGRDGASAQALDRPPARPRERPPGRSGGPDSDRLGRHGRLRDPSTRTIRGTSVTIDSLLVLCAGMHRAPGTPARSFRRCVRSGFGRTLPARASPASRCSFPVHRPRSDSARPPAVSIGSMYAVIETGGKQYRVEVGTELEVELLDADAGDSIKVERVLLVADGETAAIGRPVVENASVAAEIVRRDRGPKPINFKYGPKTRRRVKKG